MATTKKSTKASSSVRKVTPTKTSKPAAKGAAKASAPKTSAKAAPRKSAATKASSTATKTTATAKQPTRRRTAAGETRAPAGATAAGPAAAGNGATDDHEAVPPPRGHTKDGIAYTKDFDTKFLKAQRDLLTAERKSLVGQADRLEDEANSLIEDGEMGDVQFDDESGEGDTMVVERERDLALSAQARQIVADIDAALDRMAIGTYGYSLVSGRPIPRERLEAIPWATELVEEKVGGIGRR